MEETRARDSSKTLFPPLEVMVRETRVVPSLKKLWDWLAGSFVEVANLLIDGGDDRFKRLEGLLVKTIISFSPNPVDGILNR